MITREDYQRGLFSASAYYGQFVMEHHKQLVKDVAYANLEFLVDCLGILKASLKETGEVLTVAARIAILKEAKRQLEEEN